MRVSVMYSTLIVSSLEESVAFYRDTLGFSEGYHVDLPNGMGQITIMESPGAASVELIESPAFEVGMYSIGTDVDDLDAVLAELAAKGCEPIAPIAATSVGRQTFVQDPNGVRICLIEHTDDYRRKHMGLGDVVEEFHRMWDAFPGMARLISADHAIIAANDAAIERGFEPGKICAKVGTPESHRGCLMRRMLETGEGAIDMPDKTKARGWVPIAGRPDLFVHFTLFL